MHNGGPHNRNGFGNGRRNGRRNQGGGHTHNYPFTGTVNTENLSWATIMQNAPPGETLEIAQHVHSGNFPPNSGTHRHAGAGTGGVSPRGRRNMGRNNRRRGEMRRGY